MTAKVPVKLAPSRAPARAGAKISPASRAVQTELKSQLPYWMRWLPMTWFRDLILLIRDASPKPSAMALGPLGAKYGILRKKDGSPLSESAMYHYRMALRHLGVVDVRDGLYHLNESKPEVAALLHAGRRGAVLSSEERDALSSLILSNDDCRRVFLRLFMRTDRFGLSEFRSEGSPCFLYYPDGTEEIVVENHLTRRRVRYQSVNAQHASIWGVRTWCLQLDLLDELYLPPVPGTKERRHIMFVVDPSRHGDALIGRAIRESGSADGPHRETPPRAWTIEISELLGRICPSHRISTRAVKTFLARAAARSGSPVSLVPAGSSGTPTADPGQGNVDRLHQKGWLLESGRWHRKVSFQPSFWSSFHD